MWDRGIAHGRQPKPLALALALALAPALALALDPCCGRGPTPRPAVARYWAPESWEEEFAMVEREVS